jgi:transposase
MNMTREELLKLEKEEIVDLLLGVILELSETIKVQGERILELEGRLNQTSQNSSKPPSSDVYVKPKSLRKSSGKQAGGQSGQKGSGLHLFESPTGEASHMQSSCIGCVNIENCRKEASSSEVRYEIDIEIKPVVIAHRGFEIRCPLSGQFLSGEFPLGINSSQQYGLNIESLAVSLNTIGMVSINRTHELLSGVFGLPLSTGTIAGMVKNCASQVSSAVELIKEKLNREPLLHFDETGTRVDGKTQWAHVACTPELTYISVEESRGVKGMDSAGVLPDYKGTVIHDCLSSYFKYDEVRHGLCGAHLLRELTGVSENYGQAWASDMIELLLDMKDMKEAYLLKGQVSAPEELWEMCSSAYDEIVAEAQALNPVIEEQPKKKGRRKRGKVGSLVDRLALRKDQWLLFFTDFSVPFDNNQAERDIRMFKVKQKVSGCFRTTEGAKDFAKISSFIGTARKKGLSAFKAIKNALLGNANDLFINATE